VPLETAHTISN